MPGTSCLGLRLVWPGALLPWLLRQDFLSSHTILTRLSSFHKVAWSRNGETPGKREESKEREKGTEPSSTEPAL